MKYRTLTAIALAALGLTAQASAQVTLYEQEGFGGRSLTTDSFMPNLERRGLHDSAASAVVTSGRWEVCEDIRFQGRCVILRRGNYPSLAAMGLADGVSSVRAVPRNARLDDERFAPEPLVQQDFRHRNGERLFEAPVTSVRAVMAGPQQRCWVEREAVRDDSNRVPATIAGAVIGGILGHQVGGGSGRDLATVGGAVAGAAVGNRIARDREGNAVQGVQRCDDVSAQQRLDHYDVTYHFRGREHHVQMIRPPGPTITVNRLGEPRAT